jgi:hypothetical protein
MLPLVGTEPYFHQNIEGRGVISHLLLVVCFFLCSVAAVQGQAYFSEEVSGYHAGSGSCSAGSHTQLDISCRASWTDSVATGWEMAVAKNGFGFMGGSVRAEVTCALNLCSDNDSADAALKINDSLSILGLTNEPTAFLKVYVGCPECPKYQGPTGFAIYSLTAWWDEGHGFGQCTTQASPRCTLKIPIIYDANGQPLPVLIARGLNLHAVTKVFHGVAGAPVTTVVEIHQADVGASVVDAHGRIIEGVTVVGASGHIYN